jgi:hypothetical protein
MTGLVPPHSDTLTISKVGLGNVRGSSNLSSAREASGWLLSQIFQRLNRVFGGAREHQTPSSRSCACRTLSAVHYRNSSNRFRDSSQRVPRVLQCTRSRSVNFQQRNQVTDPNLRGHKPPLFRSVAGSRVQYSPPRFVGLSIRQRQQTAAARVTVESNDAIRVGLRCYNSAC